MPELISSDSCPSYSKVYYNYETEVGRLLAELNRSTGTQVHHFTCLRSENDAAPRRVLLHVAEVLPQFIKVDACLFWYTCYKHSTTEGLGNAFREFLAQIWLRQAGADYLDEAAVASLFLDECHSLEEYFRLNVLPLLSKVTGKHILIALDLKLEDAATEPFAFSNIQGLLKLTQAHANVQVSIVIICSRVSEDWLKGYLDNLEMIDLPPLPPNIETALDQVDAKTGTKRGRKPGRLPTTEVRNPEAARLLYPLALLNGAAAGHVIDYIKESVPSADLEITDLISQNILFGLRDNGVALTKRGLQMSGRIAPRDLGIHRHLVPNGAKILSFAAPLNYSGRP